MSKRSLQSSKSITAKRARITSYVTASTVDWPAPAAALAQAREFIRDCVVHKRRTLIVPDKDADGLSAGTMLHRTLIARGLPSEQLLSHHLSKGNSVHSEIERKRMVAYQAERVIVLDQGSRPGAPIIPSVPTLIIDHHMSDQWPEEAMVLTACRSPPIATTSLLTYCLLEGEKVNDRDNDWRAVLGVYGDLGPSEAKWGDPPWPAELQQTVNQYGSKSLLDAVSAINAPRRTADYDVRRAWEILLKAKDPREVSNNAFLKLCKLDVADETAKWARTAPKFSADGRIVLIEIHSGFQIHPVIATRWAGTLGKKSPKLVMVMCANSGFNPDPDKISFSCRLPSTKRNLPEDEKPNLIELLKQFGDDIPGFNEVVGEDFARGHKEATGGIIPRKEFQRLIEAIGIGHKKAEKRKEVNQSIGKYFKPVSNA